MKNHYNILYLCLEFEKWNQARPWSYQANLGLEDGFFHNGMSFFTITSPWLGRLKDLCLNKTFDQVWVEIVHQNIDKNTFEFIEKIAPIRVGLLFESLTYDELETSNSLVLKKRKVDVENKIKYLTHLIAVDELDVEYFFKKFNIPSFWWISCMPSKFLKNICVKNKKIPKAVFSGTLYGKRVKLIEYAIQNNLVVHQNSPDKNNFSHFIFDFIHLILKKIIVFWPCILRIYYRIYILTLRIVRAGNFKIYLQSISNYSIVLNLPSLVKAYPGRVSEAMSVGSVVLTNKIENRPKNNSLFIDSMDLIFYEEDYPDEFIIKLIEILENEKLRQQIIVNSFMKIKKNHTIELRIFQIKNWILSQKVI